MLSVPGSLSPPVSSPARSRALTPSPEVQAPDTQVGSRARVSVPAVKPQAVSAPSSQLPSFEQQQAQFETGLDAITPEKLRRSLPPIKPRMLQSALSTLAEPRSASPLKAVWALGSDATVQGSAQSLLGKAGHTRFDPQHPPGPGDKLTLVAHGSPDGRAFAGLSPQDLARTLKAQGITALETLSLKGCHSAAFAQVLQRELQAEGIAVSRITGRTGDVVLVSTGQTLVELDGKLVHQAKGSKVAVTAQGVSDVYAERPQPKALASGRRLEALGHSGRLGADELIRQGNVEVLAEMLENQTLDPNALIRRHTPLSWVVTSAPPEKKAVLIELLLKHGAHIDAPDKSAGDRPLIHALLGRQHETLTLLLEKGAQVGQLLEGPRPLMMAMRINDPAAIEILLKHGASIGSGEELSLNQGYFVFPDSKKIIRGNFPKELQQGTLTAFAEMLQTPSQLPKPAPDCSAEELGLYLLERAQEKYQQLGKHLQTQLQAHQELADRDQQGHLSDLKWRLKPEQANDIKYFAHLHSIKGNVIKANEEYQESVKLEGMVQLAAQMQHLKALQGVCQQTKDPLLTKEIARQLQGFERAIELDMINSCLSDFGPEIRDQALIQMAKTIVAKDLGSEHGIFLSAGFSGDPKAKSPMGHAIYITGHGQQELALLNIHNLGDICHDHPLAQPLESASSELQAVKRRFHYPATVPVDELPKWLAKVLDASLGYDPEQARQALYNPSYLDTQRAKSLPEFFHPQQEQRVGNCTIKNLENATLVAFQIQDPEKGHERFKLMHKEIQKYAQVQIKDALVLEALQQRQSEKPLDAMIGLLQTAVTAKNNQRVVELCNIYPALLNHPLELEHTVLSWAMFTKNPELSLGLFHAGARLREDCFLKNKSLIMSIQLAILVNPDAYKPLFEAFRDQSFNPLNLITASPSTTLRDTIAKTAAGMFNEQKPMPKATEEILSWFA